MTVRVSLNLARILLIVGLGVGLLSLRDTVGHIGNPDFLMPGNRAAPTHGWYHFFREAGGSIAKMAVLLLVFFGPATWRSPVTWWIALILMLGYYAPFWVGEPFLPVLSAPNRSATIIHVAMTVFSMAALVVAWKPFRAPAGAR